jgi:hypothetical protein
MVSCILESVTHANALSESLFCGGIFGARCPATSTPNWSLYLGVGHTGNPLRESLLCGVIFGATLQKDPF